MTLPVPKHERWKPLRGGLMNLYLYEDLQLLYEDGRLLLRGNNGTGKSRILALQLPFLLDGEITPSRVEPDGDPSKRIEWHLLMDGRHADRVGYTWLELGRLDDGEPRYLTLGCGMKAVQGRGAPERWFFVTEQRVGLDLSLKSPADVPHHRRALEQALDERGRLFLRAKEYRAAVDQALFGLGEERYGALLDLLIQLRSPQLARKLDEKRLSDALSRALPPLSQSVLGDVAEAFRSLEKDRHDLEGERRVLDSARTFDRDYRRYVQVATRRAAGALRRAHNRYDHTLRQLREAEQELEEARGQRGRVRDALERCKRALAEDDEAVRVLEADPTHRDARRLDEARERAEHAERAWKRAREDRQRAAEELERARRAREGAEVAHREHAAGVERREGALRASAGPVGLSAIVSLPDDEATERVRARRRHAEHLVRQAATRDARRAEALDRRREVERARAELDRARERLADAKRARDEALAELEAQLEAWLARLEVLAAPEAGPLLEALAEWGERGEGDDPIGPAVSASYGEATAALAAERARLEREQEALASRRRELDEELAELADGVHRAPAPPPWRAERPARPGAPLWALCEFREEVAPKERAGLEAALEAAGILDAWVTPDGRVLDDAGADVFLVGAARVAERALGTWLAPSIDPADPLASQVAPETVAGILDAIATEPAGSAWVSPDGRFGLGVLRGRADKAEAEHIGHAAREQARRRRIAVLEAERTALEETQRDLSARLEALEARRERAEAERRSAPSARPLQATVVSATLADEEARERAEADREAAAALEAASEELARAEARLREEADELGLGDWVDRPSELEETLRAVERALERTQEARARAAEAAQQLEERRATETRAREEHARRQALERESADGSRRAAATHRTLRETVGAKVKELEQRLAEARRRRSEGERRRDALLEEQAAAERRVGSAEQAAQDREEQRAEREAARAERVGRLHALARTGVWANLGARWRELEVPAEWSPTAAVETARELERELRDVPDDDDAWQRVNSGLQQRVQDLQTALLARNLRPRTEHRAEVFVVTVALQGRELAPAALVDELEREIASRQRLLDERERAVLEEHLIVDVAARLHERIRAGERLVESMNAEIESRPLSTGMRLRFRWKPNDDDGLAAVRRRLLSSESVWSEADRAAISRFLHERIQDERVRSETGTWLEHLSAALDYRAWHRFEIERQQNGRWKTLTRRTYGTGSGGEKAIALTLPQLAAAAAHYGSASPHAPRLILLDEAFVGIDGDMRAKCMDLLRHFDLDFVMTSEREWGCYDTVPALAIYQLVTRPGLDAVHETRWVWNGRTRERGADPGPAHGSAA